MMFDPPDFPYKELTDSISEHYSTDDLLFNNDAVVIDSIPNDKDLVKITEEIISSVENHLPCNSNNAGQTFNIESRSTLDAEQNIGLYVLQSDSSLNYEPTLLDDNTVNQFLLPVQTSSNKEKDSENIGPDLLALYSCVICHEIFTTDADLLDHTISAHVSDQPLEQETTTRDLSLSTTINNINLEEPNISSECEWLVCGVCERVLSTALESEPREQLCCTDISGKGSVGSRRLTSMFVCEYCSYLFATGEALDRHRLTCFGQEDFYPIQSEETIIESNALPLPENYIFCNICGKQCETEEELKHHGVECHKPTSRRRPYNTRNSNKMWNCGSCNQLFTTARELYRHKRGEDRPPGTPLMAYVCEECDKVLGSMCALHTHKKMHKVSKPGYPCRVCGRRFNQSGHLAIHMRMHTGERPYPCDLCSKAFKVKVERDDHRRTHTGERPFACAACPKTFTAAARLREHARIHTDQRPYKCDICGAAFRRPYARTVHTLIHTGEKPHECDVCGTAFRRSGDMWKHKRTLHGIQATSGDAK